MIHFESNYFSVKINAIQGQRLVNSLVSGNEVQAYRIGQSVNSTELSPYRFNDCLITDVYKENGYYRYIVLIDGKKHTFRQKDITASK